MKQVKKIWQGWKWLAEKLGNLQALIILSLFYYILLAPFALVFKLLADPLQLSPRKRSMWFSKENKNVSNLAKMKQQF